MHVKTVQYSFLCKYCEKSFPFRRGWGEGDESGYSETRMRGKWGETSTERAMRGTQPKQPAANFDGHSSVNVNPD